MSFLRWHLAVVFGLMASVGLSGPSNAQGHDQQQPSQQAGATKANEGPADIPFAPLPIPPASPEKQQSGGGKPPEPLDQDFNILGDTPAQWVMAGVSILALFLSAWAVYLIYATLKATRAAVVEANAGTAAAREAASITRAIGEAQVQAYLSVADFKFAIDGLTECAAPIFTIKNSGQSPSVRGEVSLLFVALHHEMGQPAMAETRSWVNLPIPDLGPGEVETFPISFLDAKIPRSKYGANFEVLLALNVEIVLFWDNVFHNEQSSFCQFMVNYPDAVSRTEPREGFRIKANYPGFLEGRLADHRSRILVRSQQQRQ